MMAFYKWLINLAGLDQRRCACCHETYCVDELDADSATLRLCPACLAMLRPYAGQSCKHCGLPAASGRRFGGGSGLCGQCAGQARLWQGRAFHGLYTGQLRELILRLKFGADLPLAHLFADFLFQAALCLPRPDMILAAPQYPASLGRRGFNQAHEMAKAMARLAGLPCSSQLLLRVRGGKPQEELSARERRRNLDDAFWAHPQVGGMNIWLVDDVFTTGSTCRACCQALRKAGAARIHLLFVARTPLG